MKQDDKIKHMNSKFLEWETGKRYILFTGGFLQ